jgi:peptidoglycan/LPS O-acetylase OafA/YrhL
MQPSQPVGRALRIVFGLALIIYVAPVYFRIPVSVTINSLLLMLGLGIIYCLINIAVVRQIVPFSPALGAIVASGLLIALYVVGGSGLPIVGRGKGQLAAITFLGVSLVIAGLRALPGCEVMAIPSLLFRKHAELPCLIFSPLDRLESKLQRNRDV